MLSNSNLEAFCNLRKDEVRKAIKEIYSKGERRDRILANLLPVLAHMLDLLVKPNISDFFPVLARFDIQGVAKEITTLLQKVEEITEDTIDERIKNPSNKTEAAEATKDGRTDFLQILIDLMQEEDNKNSLGKTQIKAMLINILVGGTDTSSTTIEWIMAELLCHPNVMEKVQNELNKVVGLNNIVEESHILKLEYLDAVVKETLRLYPLGPLLTPRTPSNLALWEDTLYQRIPLFFLMSAERMVRLVLASLLHSFKWQLLEGEKLDMSGKLRLTLRKKIPLRAIPVPRLSNTDLYE
ncbi:Flavonoid 3'-monooxygenase [Sesamum angolense]|uniref:Flavonoid 3'-monooxygenase n=1 Tax=Sesamum angolense TaxID=2727404 RepID=A0AAE1T479_9LAMI|nr:Flavonoid 3'-monooxygenase [Sesamum angolense]